MKENIDISTTITPVKSSAITIAGLLGELKQALKEEGIKIHKHENGEFYHPDILTWFPNAQVLETSCTMHLLELPAYGMTRYEIIYEARVVKKMTHEHSLAEYIKVIITLVKNNYFSKNDTHTIGFLKEKKDGDISCELYASVSCVGGFYLEVCVTEKPDGLAELISDHSIFLGNN